MAVLAQSLARSAIGVLEASELENAKQVDFEHLDARSKAEVTERFADAIESVAQAVHDGQDEAFLPEMIDAQVSTGASRSSPRENCRRRAREETAWEVKAEAPAPAPVAPRSAVGNGGRGPVASPEAPGAEVPRRQKRLPRPRFARSRNPKAGSSRARAEPVAAAVVRPESPSRWRSPRSHWLPRRVAAQPLAQVQFMGAAQPPVSATGGGPLETAVREMLRPLLVQWLNENMPRILESAIREEISVRGLLPKSDS